MPELSEEYKSLIDQYPKIVQKQLDKVFNTAIEVLGEEKIKAIILVGSAARSEISFIEKSDGIDIYSDYEYVVVTQGIIPSYLIHRLKKRNESLEVEFGVKSPLFSIDFGVSSFKKWKLTPPTLWAFEVFACGVTVFGDDVKGYLGPIGIKNLDMGNLNYLILVRLWNMLVHLPKNCIVGTPSKYEIFIANFYYARNILDILTVYLPNQKILRAGYGNRFIEFQGLESIIFDKHEQSIIMQANDLKLNKNCGLGFDSAKKVFFTGYLKLLAHVSNTDEWDLSPDSLMGFLDSVSLKNPFDEKMMKKGRRIVNETKMYFNLLCEKLDKERLLWFFIDKRYCVLGALISLHAVFLSQFTIAEKKKFINIATEHIEKLVLRKIDFVSSDIFHRVDELRRILLEFMLNWFYANRLISKREILKSMDYKEVL